MKRTLALLAALAVLSAAPLAFAQDSAPDFATLDADQSGEISFDELTSAMPDVTQDDFSAADTDQSGGLSADEYAAFVGTDASGGMGGDSGSDSSN